MKFLEKLNPIQLKIVKIVGITLGVIVALGVLGSFGQQSQQNNIAVDNSQTTNNQINQPSNNQINEVPVSNNENLCEDPLSILGQWKRPLDGFVVDFKENGGKYEGVTVDLGSIAGNFGVTVGEKMFDLTKTSEGQYDGTAKIKLSSTNESWQPTKQIINGDKMTGSGDWERVVKCQTLVTPGTPPEKGEYFFKYTAKNPLKNFEDSYTFIRPDMEIHSTHCELTPDDFSGLTSFACQGLEYERKVAFKVTDFKKTKSLYSQNYSGYVCSEEVYQIADLADFAAVNYSSKKANEEIAAGGQLYSTYRVEKDDLTECVEVSEQASNCSATISLNEAEETARGTFSCKNIWWDNTAELYVHGELDTPTNIEGEYYLPYRINNSGSPVIDFYIF